MPPPPIAASSLLILLSAACASSGPTRLYDGEARAPGDEAVLRIEAGNDDVGGILRSLTPFRRQAQFLEIDGQTPPLYGTRFAILPGPHDVCAAFTNDFGSFLLLGMLEFEAVAGREYVVELRSLEQGTCIVVVDEASDEVLDDSSLTSDEAQVLDLDFGGEEWSVADQGASCRQTSMTWLPEGESLKRWTRMVEVMDTSFRDGEEADLDFLLAERRAALDQHVEDPVMTLIEQTDELAAYAYSGDFGKRGRHEPRFGVGLLRARPQGVVLCIYEQKEEISDAQRELWLRRFR